MGNVYVTKWAIEPINETNRKVWSREMRCCYCEVYLHLSNLPFMNQSQGASEAEKGIPSIVDASEVHCACN